MINRRGFLLTIISLPLVNKLVPSSPKFAWDKLNYKPHPSQLAFMEREGPDLLWGIPYHQSNSSIGSWCGISRSTPETQKAIIEMINKIRKHESL